jgi:hypothetical protein
VAELYITQTTSSPPRTVPYDIAALLAYIKILEKGGKYFEEHFQCNQCCSLVTPVSLSVGKANSNGNNEVSSPSWT